MAAPPTKVRSENRRFVWSSLALVAGLFGLVTAFTLWVPWNCRGAPTEGPFSGPGPCIGVLPLLAIPIFLLLELAWWRGSSCTLRGAIDLPYAVDAAR